MSFGTDGDDPTDFEGIYPVPGILPVKPPKARKDPRSNASTGAQAAGVRAFTAQAIAFYFRAPAKAFFRTRVDYLAYARNLQQQHGARANDATSRRLTWLRSTTPGVIASAVRFYGWKVIPEQILPPLIANVSVGAILYTSYLQILGQLHEESSHAAKRVYPPPSPGETFTAGYLAGSIQSLVAAPLDAIQIRYERYGTHEMAETSKTPQSMWAFGKEKLREVGPRGVFAGWGLSFLKDSFGSAVFFSTFEVIKSQGYYNFIRWYYSGLNESTAEDLAKKRPHTRKVARDGHGEMNAFIDAYHTHRPNPLTIKPHYAIEPSFLFLAGISASLAQSVIIYPLHHIQVQHWEHLEELDAQANKLRHSPRLEGHSKWRMMRVYYRAYQETFQHCKELAASETQGSLRRWLYRGFWWNTTRQLPSTSAGLIIFELVRRKYGFASDEVRISGAQDNYDILLN